VKRAVTDLARRLYVTRSRAALDRTLMVVFDLPYGAARRYLITGTTLPTGLRGDLTAVIKAVIDRLSPSEDGRVGRYERRGD
jgi:hypothetical protein